MYKPNNNRIHQLIAISLLLGSTAIAEEMQTDYLSDSQPQNMAAEILAQGESALAKMTQGQQMANDWHRQGQIALAAQLQRPSSETVAILEPNCAEKKTPLASASQHLKQIKG